jgi:uncharacterized protein
MMLHRTRYLLLGALLCVSRTLTAQAAETQVVDTVAEPRDAAKIALVAELMATANFRQQLVRTMRESSTRQGSLMPVPPGFWEKFLARAEQDADTLLAPMKEDYARYFTSADLRALIAFYKSPTGQRLSLVAPVLSANSSYFGTKWGQRVGMEVAGELSKQPGAADTAPPAKGVAPRKP